MEVVSGLCTCGDSHRFGAGKASFIGSIFSSKTEVIGGRGGGWTVLDLGASLLSMRKGNETRKGYETPWSWSDR